MILSIIIPCFNAHDTIRRALDSVYRDSFQIEYIISDDNSDKPYDYLKTEYPNLQITRSEVNRGAGVARNQGMKLAKGDWICFLDADDELLIEDLISFVTDYNDFDIIKGRVTWSKGYKRENISIIPSFMVHGTFFKRKFLMDNNLHFHPQLRIYEDTYFMKLSLHVTKNVYYVDDIIYALRYNPNSTTAKIQQHTKYKHWWHERFNDNLKSALYYAMDVTDPSESICQYNISGYDTEYDVDNNLFDTVHNYIDFSKKITPKYKLSVIIPLYNSHKYIETTLDKFYEVMRDYSGQFEVICTDDGSTDYDYSYLTDKFSNLTVLYNTQRKYMGENRNRGLRYARGEWVMFLDHDDEKCKEGIDYFMGLDTSNLNIILLAFASRIDGQFHDLGIKDYCIHGCVCRTNFLREYGILFNDDLQTSEDIYFHRRLMNVVEKYNLRETLHINDSILLGIWNHRADSTFNSKYNNRCFTEEFFYTSVIATVESCRFDGVVDSEMLRDYLHDEYYWRIIQFLEWQLTSLNFKSSNLKVLLAISAFLTKMHDDMDSAPRPDIDYDRTTKLHQFLCDSVEKMTDHQKEKLLSILHI